MPIYEYACDGCGHRFEEWQKVSEPVRTDCPSCHEGRARRLISATSFALKGTGWYASDYKNSKGSQGAQEKPGEQS